jgi:heat shock protein 90kDa beta
VWTSTADAKFFVTKDPRGDTLGRGTRVTLHLKDDAIEYVEQDKIKNLVKKYSEFIQYPIKLFLSKEIRKTVPDEEAAAEKPADETPTNEDDAEIKDEGETKPTEEEKPAEPKTKTVTEQVWEWETINEVKAIWLREKSEITEEEYNNFYKTITKDHENPLAYTHFSAEGEIEFKAILFIPSNAPYDLFENYYGKSSALKLYVRRVLITEEFEELMPRYLNFIKGVVDSDDLPLNVSREQLQQLKMIKVMSKKLIRKAIEMIRALAEDDEEEDDDDDTEEDNEDTTDDSNEDAEEEKDEKKSEDEDKYGKFWKNFGKNIKLGVIEDASNRSKLAKLLR